MAHTQDFIPARDAEFDGWLANLTGYVDGKVTGGQWTHIPADKVAALKQHNTDWHAAYVKTLGPHTAVDTEAKNDQRKAAEGFVRPFVQQYLRFDPVTNEDRTAMNLHNRDTTNTAIGVPASRSLIIDLRSLGGFQVEIRFQDEATPESHAIPYGDNGCLLNFTWGTEKVTDYAALTQTQLMTRSPYVLSLPPEAEAKFLTCAPRRQNERGKLGPWGDIQHIVIG
ncbi:hypothetical protein FACS1894147_03770 [Spirochaetia bacterium]|nr:hypothetical protein FACS1894147_03770 [Spirochaetia bacterium]